MRNLFFHSLDFLCSELCALMFSASLHGEICFKKDIRTPKYGVGLGSELVLAHEHFSGEGRANEKDLGLSKTSLFVLFTIMIS